MNSGEISDAPCTENEQIQVPARRPRVQFNSLVTNSFKGILGIKAGCTRERKKAEDSKAPPTQSSQQTCHNNSQTTNNHQTGNDENKTRTPNPRNYKPAGNFSKSGEYKHNFLDRLSTSEITDKPIENCSKNDKRINNSFKDSPKSRTKSDVQIYSVRQTVEQKYNNNQERPKPFLQNSNLSETSSQNLNATKYDASSFKNQKDYNIDLGHQVNIPQKAKEVKTNSYDTWDDISVNGDHPEDGWGSDEADTNKKGDKISDQSKSISSSKSFQNVEPTKAVCSAQQSYKSLDDRSNKNWGETNKRDINNQNSFKNVCLPSNGKQNSTQGRFSKPVSQESENKEFYRTKSDLHGSNINRYHEKNTSKLDQNNSSNRNFKSNESSPHICKTETIETHESFVRKNNRVPGNESSGWPELDIKDKTHGCDDIWGDSSNQEVGLKEPQTYQRSNSTHFPDVRKNFKRDGRGDEPYRDIQPENSRPQRELSKPNLIRSTSFKEQTHTRDTNRTPASHDSILSTESHSRLDYEKATNSNAEASNNFQPECSRFQHGSSKVNLSRSTSFTGRSNSNVPNRVSGIHSTSQASKTESHSKAYHETPNSNTNASDFQETRNGNKNDNQSGLESNKLTTNSDEEWNTLSDTSEVSTVVLEDNMDRKRIVMENSMGENLKIVVSCHNPPTVDPNQKINQENSKIEEAPFLDPLQDDFDFFDDSPDTFIPAPQPPTAAFAAKNIQEITSYLLEVETEKAVPLETSKSILKDIIKALKRTSLSSWGKDFVSIYGSYVSGLAVSTSNINFAIKTDIIKNSYLFQLQRGFLSELKGYQVEPFDEEKDPKKSKICFTETNTGIPCELVFHTTKVSNYLIMSKMLSNVCEFDPRIKTLLIATRIWAEVCLIHEPEEGKLHPVGYSLLMLHFLQGLEKPLLPILNTDPSVKYWGLNQLKEKNDSSVGELWLAFLKYYSEFNWGDSVVTVSSKTKVSKSSKFWEQSHITIEDPFTLNNIGDSVVSEQCAEFIFACFKASYEYFSTPFDYEDSESSDSEGSNSFKKELLSFNYISFDQNVPSVCERCEELDETCNKCRPRKAMVTQALPALSESSLKYVDKTIQDICNEYMLHENETKERIAFVKLLESDLRKNFPGATLKLFGSSVNGFGFKKSDIDICMTLNHKPESKQEITKILHQIVKILRKRPQLYENVYGLYHAKIPIVKFHAIRQDWLCDLSLYNILAVHNSKLLRQYSMYDERCRILGCAMKLLSKKACLDDTHHLSSYSYVLTVIHYLQQVEPPVLPVFPIEHKEVFSENLVIPRKELNNCNFWLTDNSEQLKGRYELNQVNESSVGELWLGLLNFFARYDGTNAITITQKEPLPSSSLRRSARLLNIQDPFLEKDNLGCILNDEGADETRKVLTRARLLFGKEIPNEHKDYPKRYFFSSSNLTGCPIKEIECDGCGGFGHHKSECLKADPFKRSKFKLRVPKKTPQKLRA